MKNKITFISLILLVCFMIPALLCGCGEPKKYAWDSEFMYSGVYSNNWESSAKNGSRVKDLLLQEYTADNLDFSKVKINNVTNETFKSGAENFDALITMITSEAESYLNDQYVGLTIKINNLENKTLHINSYNFKFDVAGDNDYDYYRIIDETKEEGNQIIGYFSSVLKNFDNNENVLQIDLSNSGTHNISIKIPTKEIISDSTALADYDENHNIIRTYIPIHFDAYLSLVERV